jgi:exonuclease III
LQNLQFIGVPNNTEFKHNSSQDYSKHLSNPKVSNEDLVIFHQNIRGLNSNKLKLSISLLPGLTRIICLKEHHLCTNAIDSILLTRCNLGAKFCRNTFKNGGVCIFVHESIQLTKVTLAKYCKEKDLEVCALKLHLLSCEICIIAIYRSPGNFQYFLHNLEEILNMTFGNTTEIIICGDINISYLNDSTYKHHLDLLLASHALYSIGHFSTRIQNNSYSAIYNIFSNKFKFIKFSVYPIINGLSDHDAQGLIICNILGHKCNKGY